MFVLSVVVVLLGMCVCYLFVCDTCSFICLWHVFFYVCVLFVRLFVCVICSFVILVLLSVCDMCSFMCVCYLFVYVCVLFVRLCDWVFWKDFNECTGRQVNGLVWIELGTDYVLRFTFRFQKSLIGKIWHGGNSTIFYLFCKSISIY